MDKQQPVFWTPTNGLLDCSFGEANTAESPRRGDQVLPGSSEKPLEDVERFLSSLRRNSREKVEEYLNLEGI
jgi:hypothetical protein